MFDGTWVVVIETNHVLIADTSGDHVRNDGQGYDTPT